MSDKPKSKGLALALAIAATIKSLGVDINVRKL